MLSVERLLDPQGLNLYGYTRNRPTIAIDDGGLATVLVLVEANQSATVFHIADTGRITIYEGLARGTSRDRSQVNADTPFGKYQVTGVDIHKMSTSYGSAKINLKHIYGESAPKRTLDDIRLHGGGRGLRKPYAGYQPLINTWGCVRMYNKNIISLATDLRDEGDYSNDYVYVGDRNYIEKLIRDTKDNPDLQWLNRRFMPYFYSSFNTFDLLFWAFNFQVQATSKHHVIHQKIKRKSEIID